MIAHRRNQGSATCKRFTGEVEFSSSWGRSFISDWTNVQRQSRMKTLATPTAWQRYEPQVFI